MLAFVLRRFLQGMLVMLVVGFIAFGLFNFVGDPVSLMLPPEATSADRDQMRQILGLDKPFYVQFTTFLANAVQGNFGISLRLGRPVSALIAERLPATLVMRLVRSEMLEVLRTDYIRFARARGLNDRAVNFGHALKNTLIPVITITGLQLGAIIAFAIITETVFQWPGMGLLFIQAVQFADIPVMAAYLCLIGLIFVGINLVVDILYFVVDPRLRVERGGSGGPCLLPARSSSFTAPTP